MADDTARQDERRILQPPGWARPRGYSNGVAVGQGRLVFLAGQIGWDAEQRLVGPGFADQFRQCLLNIRLLLAEAGGTPADLVRLTWFVTDLDGYRAAEKEMGAVYREVFGRVFPAMSVVAVAALLEPGARLEIEATAVIPDKARDA